ncbi:MAG: carbon-nitrogen hydrolase family protein [Rhodobiaceae bacterium]|nr:carbon-nitrogen hydrolase family protein [Rhodobiaceae bacterium]MCC0052580.1 carbon-nitrogen hydrolase family protein [Rhodobiaceae bacterium]
MRLGIFQCEAGGLTPQQRLDRLARIMDGQRLDLLVCPELFLSGYDVGADLHALAEPADGPFSRAIAALAQEHGTAIAYGFPERAGEHVYNSASCIAADGTRLATHRKTVLPPGFESDHFALGSEPPALFDVAGLRCSIAICYEVEFPESVRAAAKAGAEVVIVPTALVEEWHAVAHRMVPTRALENGVWLAYANHTGSENTSRYLGASCILSPFGDEVARAGGGEELIIAQADRQTLAAAHARLPYLADLQSLRVQGGK